MRPTVTLLTVSLMLSTACGRDNSLGVNNEDPTAEITSPSPSDSLRAPYPVTFTGLITDLESGPDLRFGTWTINGVVACAEAPTDSSGYTSCTVPAELGTMEVILDARDGTNGTDSVRETYTVIDSDPPEVVIQSPVPDGRYYSNIPVSLAGTVSDTEDEPEALRAQWSTGSADLGSEAVPTINGEVAQTELFAEGEHTVMLTVTDTVDKTGMQQVTFFVGGPNRAPTCAITQPLAATFGEALATTTLSAQIGDDDEGPTSLSVTWESDLDGAIGSATADATGLVQTDWLLPTAGAHRITLTVTDEAGERCTDTIDWTAHLAPEVTITAPSINSVFNAGEEVVFQAEVADDLTPAEALVISWSSDVDGSLGTSIASSAGLTEAPVSTLTAGSHTVTVTAADLEGLSSSASVPVRINGLPSAPVIEISPETPLTTDNLVGAITTPSVDPEGDPISYSWSWLRVGDTTPAATGQTLASSATATGETWELSATPSDGRGSGPAGTVQVTIANTPPVASSVNISPSAPQTGDTMSCEAEGSDLEGSAVTFTYRWSVNGSDTGVVGAEVAGLAFKRDDTVSCIATPSDGTSDGTPLQADAVVVNALPSADARLSPSDPSSNEDVTCLVDTDDPDGDSVTVTFAWTVNTITAASTEATLPSSFYAADDEITCFAVPNDGLEDGPTAEASADVGNGAPSLTGVTLNTDSPVPTQDLVATPEGYSDPDGDPAGDHVYSWYVQPGGSGDWISVGDNSNTLSSDEFDRNDKIYVEVVPRDTFGAEGEPVSSDVAEVYLSWTQVSVAAKSSCGVQPGGSLWCWGDNTYGQLGDGSVTQRRSPVRVGADNTWKQVAAGGGAFGDPFTCAVDADGGLWCWGRNHRRQAGQSDTSAVLRTPTQVGSDTDWSSVAAGDYHACAIKSDQSLWCWGYNNNGQIGIGTESTSAFELPVEVSGGKRWLEVTAGDQFTCGRQTDRRAYCWGFGGNGQLGTGSVVEELEPAVVGGSSWTTIHAGGKHTCGTRSGGDAYCWGNGSSYRLGNDEVFETNVPVSVKSDMTSVAAGIGSFSCGVGSSGGLWCWGENRTGGIGFNDLNERTVPARVGSGDDWISVDSGKFHSCGLRGDGDLWCWGHNSDGQLGLGDLNGRLTPTQVDAN